MPVMKLAQRMVGIGTETAFEALPAPARSRRRAGTSSIWRSASPTSTPRRTSATRPSAPSTRAGRTTARRSASPSCARPSPTSRQRVRGIRRRPGQRGRHARRQADHVLRDPGPDRGGRRGHLPGPGLPDLRVDDPLRRRHAGALRAARGERLPLRRRRAARAGHARDEADHLQLAPQPDRRRADARRHRPPSPTSRASATSRSWPTRSTAAASTRASTSPSPRCPGMAERTIVLDGFSQDLRHDRLAAGLRDLAAGAGRCRSAS